MDKDTMKGTDRADEGSLFDSWTEAIEDGVRSRVRDFIEALLEEKLSQRSRVRATAGGKLAKPPMGRSCRACATDTGSAL